MENWVLEAYLLNIHIVILIYNEPVTSTSTRVTGSYNSKVLLFILHRIYGYTYFFAIIKSHKELRFLCDFIFIIFIEKF